MNQKVDIPPSSDSDSKDEIEDLVCEWLDTHFDDISAERVANSRMRRRIGWVIVVIAAVMPLYILHFLWEKIMINDSIFSSMDAIPQAVLISGSFLSFIILYAVLIKGMFQEEKASELSSTMKEAVEVVRSLDKGGN